MCHGENKRKGSNTRSVGSLSIAPGMVVAILEVSTAAVVTVASQ